MRVLVIRFSALGDIALTVPVIQNVIKANPQAEITVLSRPFVAPLFKALPVKFYGADLKNKHKGISGLYKLYRSIKKQHRPDVVIDLHSVLRTTILNTFFKLGGTPVFKIDKGRKAKKALTRRDNKVSKPLLHTCQRYANVFKSAGLEVDFDPRSNVELDYKSQTDFKRTPGHHHIAIAPFAFHKGKSWPLEKMEKLIIQLIDDGHFICLFGGPSEKEELDNLLVSKDQMINLASTYSLDQEICIMKQMDLMIAMDSSNMHLATLAGIPVISIWGATHRYSGFGPLGNNEKNIVEIETEHLDCRPCSVFGNKDCFRKDYACLNQITLEMLKGKVDTLLLNVPEKMTLKEIREYLNLKIYKIKVPVQKLMRILSIVVASVVVSSLIYYHGFHIDDYEQDVITMIIKFGLGFYIFKYVVRLILSFHPRKDLKDSALEGILMLMVIANFLSAKVFGFQIIHNLGTLFNLQNLEDFFFIGYSILFCYHPV